MTNVLVRKEGTKEQKCRQEGHESDTENGVNRHSSRSANSHEKLEEVRNGTPSRTSGGSD